mmetsp:Transcript_33564/g.83823  ORF Transcript_33564/g.83823 Transcript_33564/m.83823 type:complete len:119 (-) Transcript_33564:316-672(-)
MRLGERSAAGAVAAGLALALSTAHPNFVSASVTPPAVVQQYGSSMLAGDDDELRPAQKEFLEKRAAMQQKYDDDYQSNFKGAVETKDKKSAYTLVVVGLVAVAFIAPMIQFFYYTGGD